MLFKSEGILKYSIVNENYYSLKVLICVDLYLYLLTRLKKYYDFNIPKYKPHISVIRKEVPPNKAMWMAYENDIVEFEYSNTIFTCGKYYWINVYCQKLAEIRQELGLIPYRYKDKLFHITIGNNK